MSAHHNPEQDHTIRTETPPIPAKTLLIAHQLPELSKQQLPEFLDRIVPDDLDIRHLYKVMVDAIRSNKVYLVKELLRCKMPISPYVLEAVNSKAKEIGQTVMQSADEDTRSVIVKEMQNRSTLYTSL
ncbi:hypothetical protein N7475_002472 [Penicillium sp. IBT 31633x]|nr:hypothetical protein N7475_002472 [Penicillium sp. IBT 31633x]